MHSAPRGRQLKRLAFLGTTTVLLSLLVAPSTGIAQAPADASSSPPGVDEIASSPNLKQVAHLDKGAFASPDAFNSDWAFQGRYAYGGNYEGFTVYDISEPTAPTIVTQVLCPGPQNDASVHGNLLFLGTDAQRTDDSCSSAGSTGSVPGARWEGIKIFDISNPASPRYVKAVKTDCGSHTLTMVPGRAGDQSVYLYISSYNLTTTNLPNCDLPHDKISIVQVPLKDPTAAAVVAEPVLFPEGGNPGGPGQRATTGCHDLTVYPDRDIAAGACMGDGALFDISDRTAPKLITTVRDTVNFAFWHSATFNNNATKVIFTDELGGGGAATCVPSIEPTRGANAIYDIIGRGAKSRLVFRSYFKIPRFNTETENCVAHNGSLIPVNGRDIMVQAWYQGGISVWEFTNSGKPTEIGYWERGPLSNERLVLGGSWSAYWYNGYIYSNDTQKGLDVLRITDRRIASATDRRASVFNAQTQEDYRNW